MSYVSIYTSFMLQLPCVCFMTEQRTVKASQFVKYLQRQGELISQSRARPSLVGDHLLYSHNLNV